MSTEKRDKWPEAEGSPSRQAAEGHAATPSQQPLPSTHEEAMAMGYRPVSITLPDGKVLRPKRAHPEDSTSSPTKTAAPPPASTPIDAKGESLGSLLRRMIAENPDNPPVKIVVRDSVQQPPIGAPTIPSVELPREQTPGSLQDAETKADSSEAPPQDNQLADAQVGRQVDKPTETSKLAFAVRAAKMKANFLVAIREPGAKVRSLKALVWLLAGVAVAAYMLVRSWDVYWFEIGATTATARVIDTHEDVREDLDGRRAGIVTVANYEFAVQNNRFGGWVEGRRGEFAIDDAIAVEYDPLDPSQNRALGDSRGSANYYMLLLLGGCLIYFIILEKLPDLRQLFSQFRPPTKRWPG